MPDPIKTDEKQASPTAPPEAPKEKKATAFFVLNKIVNDKVVTFVPDIDKVTSKPKPTGRHLTLQTATYKCKGVVSNSGPEEFLTPGAELIISGIKSQNWKLGDELKIEISEVK